MQNFSYLLAFRACLNAFENRVQFGDKHFVGVIFHGYLGCFPTSNKFYCNCMVSTKKKIWGGAMCVIKIKLQ